MNEKPTTWFQYGAGFIHHRKSKTHAREKFNRRDHFVGKKGSAKLIWSGLCRCKPSVLPSPRVAMMVESSPNSAAASVDTVLTVQTPENANVNAHLNARPASPTRPLASGPVRRNGFQRPFGCDQIISFTGHLVSAACFYASATWVLVHYWSVQFQSSLFTMVRRALAVG